MSVFKDTTRGTWTSQFYYTDSKGIKRRKHKRGFQTEKEAMDYEKNFLYRSKSKLFTFDYFTELYLNDIHNRIKRSSYEQKKYLLENKIVPYFHGIPMIDIKARDIRNWQNDLLAEKNQKGKSYSPTYLRSIYNQLNAVFNFGVRFYDIPENPCKKAGSFGSIKGKEQLIWTIDDFNRFQDEIKDINPVHSLAIEVLFFTGMRIGELLALSPEDINISNNTITINKTYHKLRGEEYISKPKTKKSERVISIPPSLSQKIKIFIFDNSEVISITNRLFSFTSAALNYTIKKYAPTAKVPVIRLHDLRHSHVSLLIELGFNVNVIAERLGHESIQTTLGIYTHLYPKKQYEVSDLLENYVSPCKVPNKSIIPEILKESFI